ncbi:MAG: hypothetical protein NW237_03470 [Cyanobacteriota bacterium]|nr:hypothetical protein [Cyanobacteriota bacterium]
MTPSDPSQQESNYFSDSFSDIPEALSPIFKMEDPNQRIDLSDLGQEITISGTTLSDYSISLVWLPAPKLRITFQANQNDINLHIGKVYYSSIPGYSDFEVLITQYRHEEIVTGNVYGSIKSQNPYSLDHIKFHLINFLDVHGQWVKNGAKSWAGRNILTWEGWKITLDQVENFKYLRDNLKGVGGFAITHVGKIEKINGESFSSEEACELLDILDYFFSFVRGIWSGTVLEVGFDTCGNKAWRRLEICDLDH